MQKSQEKNCGSLSQKHRPRYSGAMPLEDGGNIPALSQSKHIHDLFKGSNITGDEVMATSGLEAGDPSCGGIEHGLHRVDNAHG